MIIIGGVKPKELKKEGFSVFNGEVISILERVSRELIKSNLPCKNNINSL